MSSVSYKVQVHMCCNRHLGRQNTYTYKIKIIKFKTNKLLIVIFYYKHQLILTQLSFWYKIISFLTKTKGISL